MKRTTAEVRAVGLSFAFLITGVAVLWFAKSIAKVQGDAVLVTVLLVPAVVYLVVSGRLEELKGPGGLELRLVRIARETVTPADQTIAPTVDTMAVVQKMGLSDLQQVLRNIDEAKPTVMRMTLGGAAQQWGIPAISPRRPSRLP